MILPTGGESALRLAAVSDSASFSLIGAANDAGRIAAANAHGLWGRPDAGAERVTDWLARAAGEGIDLLAFSETGLDGYCLWQSDTGCGRFDDSV